MMRRLTIWTAAIAVLLASAGAGRSLAAQAPASQDRDVLAALLVEVRGLRAAMEQLAAAGPRVQLALGRLQIQEQRVNTMLRRQDEINATIASHEQQLDRMKQELAAAGDRQARASSVEEREDLERALAQLKGVIERTGASIGQLRSEEGQLAQAIAAEQARWMDINDRLDALERTLRTPDGR